MKIDKYFHLYGKGKEIVFEEVPTIEERKTGRWIVSEPQGVWTNIYHCSECGGGVMSCKVDLPKFCGHCGAKMEENG